MDFKKKVKKIAYQNRFCIAFWVIFLVIFCTLYSGITFLDKEVSEKHITTEIDEVSDKFFGNGDQSNYYLITLKSGKTYYILDKKDGQAKRMYEKIIVGKKYRFILKQDSFDNEENFTHIIEVQEVEQQGNK